MPYTPKTWADGPAGGTPVLAADLNHLENGVFSSATVYNVCDLAYGADRTGVADSTAAIQAAITAAKNDPSGGGNSNQAHQVFMPAGLYKFSNLTLPSFTVLTGEGMETTFLERIATATGPAIRDQTTAEGNPGGATGIKLRGFTLNGNSSAGDGIDLGRANRSPNPSAVTFNNNGYLSHLKVLGFPSGAGIICHSDALSHDWVEVDSCQRGIVTDSGGNNNWMFTLAQLNTSHDYDIGSNGDTFHGLQVESSCSQPILVQGGANIFFGVNVLLLGNATDIIQVAATNAALNRFYGVHVNANGHTFTNVVNFLKTSWGTGNYQTEADVIDTDAHRGGFYIFDGNAGGAGWGAHGGEIYAAAADTASLGDTNRFLVVSGKSLRTEHVGAATPTGGSSGDIKVGTGKIWVNDAGTWKSATVT